MDLPAEVVVQSLRRQRRVGARRPLGVEAHDPDPATAPALEELARGVGRSKNRPYSWQRWQVGIGEALLPARDPITFVIPVTVGKSCWKEGVLLAGTGRCRVHPTGPKVSLQWDTSVGTH